jgi:hypothetical protein
MQTSAIILGQGHQSGLKSTSADGSSMSPHIPHNLSLFIDTFSTASLECAKWDGNYK